MHIASIHHHEVRDYDFANQALALRQRAGLTQRALAAHLGVSYKAIGAWEGGVSYPGTERLKQLIALYLERGTLLAGREEEEAVVLWEAMRAKARRRTVPFDPQWFSTLRGAEGTASRGAPPPLAVVPAAAVPNEGPVATTLPVARHDWGEAPDAPAIQGRADELAALDRWVQRERCRLVLVLGEGGAGKTTLAARLAYDLAPAFPAIYWRSLRHAPPPEDWLAGAIAAIAAVPAPLPLPEGVEARLGLLLELLRERRCLLVLDNMETVLEPGVTDVRYRAGYEGYGEILRRLSVSAHHGCLLVTSREQPLRTDQTAVRALRLHGLGVDESRALLGHHDLAGDEAAWEALVARYAGNPLALQVAGETIGTVFGGEIAAFLSQDVAVFGEIRELLDEQVARLSALEHAVLAWVAEERAPVGFAALVSHRHPEVGRSAVVEAVEALARRALLERRAGGTFTLHPMVVQYATTQVGERPGQPGCAGVDGHGHSPAQPGASGRAAAAAARVWRGGDRTQHAYRPGHVVNWPALLRGRPRRPVTRATATAGAARLGQEHVEGECGRAHGHGVRPQLSRHDRGRA